METNWQKIANEKVFDTPFFAIYPERIEANIKMAIEMVEGKPNRLRPHIKTHKTGEIIDMFIRFGITKIKCATIAEAELAADRGIEDVLLAYQPVGKKIERLISLIKTFPKISFSCLVDNIQSAQAIADAGTANSIDFIKIYVDLNTGMNRTGYPFEKSLPTLYKEIGSVKGIMLLGFHIYDGHLDGLDANIRTLPAKLALQKILVDCGEIVDMGFVQPMLIAGGSNTFSFYAKERNIECSPGTFVFWDMNYTKKLPELPFEAAAVLVTTVISKPTDHTLCLDMGYKSVSSENPIDARISFPWNDELKPLSQSEEHLVVKIEALKDYQIGDRIYGIPHHVCPSIALYDELNVVADHQIFGQWKVLARKRSICL